MVYLHHIDSHYVMRRYRTDKLYFYQKYGMTVHVYDQPIDELNLMY